MDRRRGTADLVDVGAQSPGRALRPQRRAINRSFSSAPDGGFGDRGLLENEKRITDAAFGGSHHGETRRG